MQPAHNPQPQPLPSGFPNDVGKPSGMGGIAYDPTLLQPIKTICGVRRRVFFVILAAAIVAIVAGLSAGLGVALSKNNNNSAASAANGANEANGTSGGRTVTVTESASAGLPSRTTDNRPDNTSDRFNDPTGTTSSRSTPTDTSITTTPPDGPAPTEANRFSIETGFWTITFSKYSTSGNLCTFFNALHPVSTVVEPWVRGNVDSGYGATWAQTGSQVVVTNPSTTVTIQAERYAASATFAPQAVTNVPAWDFRKSTVPTVFGCEFTGLVQLLFEETGRMRYIISVDLNDECTIGSGTVPGGSTCSLYWRLVKSN
ncbi:hypothetical protein TWF506_011363 [Arthrobotrys conoides]|uniref:Uncharacterized protein n=1 Tax=Arthrobotrys conoides TaxID=74498 RepID=A0AAN8N126_9PEZI